ncbi:MAG: NAD(P)-dependent oxidoreductase [Gammaproteobacteria bacterium]|nr:NAD(P)-dependent oxidoreductase [Gammaproteobacteria bacterium]
MKILFADKFPERYLNQLRDRGHSCEYQPDLTSESLPGTVPGFDALVVRSTAVDSAAIRAGDALRIVVRAGAGTNTIDTDGAAGKQVRVCNVPGRNAVAVAELTMGLLLALDRNIPDNVIDLRAGRWNKKKYSVAEGLYGRCIGIIGLGAIGLAVAERAAAFGMRVHVIGRPGRADDVRERLAAIGAVDVDDLDRLAERCDVLSFHVPASSETKAMVNDALLSRLAPGGIILNTSRGDVVDEQALVRAMDEKGIRAGLDVFRDEPASGDGRFDSVLARHPNVYGTHHIGASTTQAQNAVAEGVVEIIDAFEQGRVLHCVNLEN